MNYQARAFQISFLLHVTLIVLVMIGSTYTGQYKRVTVIDFDSSKSTSADKKNESSTPTIKTKFMNPEVRQNSKEKKPLRLAEEIFPKSPETEIVRAEKGPETHDAEHLTVDSGVAGSDEGFVAEPSKGNTDGGKEAARLKYVSDHFAYIRDKILRNVSYPDVARRMGWQGKVILSFSITANGAVREFKVVKSSGFPILDKSAIGAVKDTAPFPKPPVEAQLVIPIIYRLE